MNGEDLSQRKRVIPYMGKICEVEPCLVMVLKKHAHVWGSLLTGSPPMPQKRILEEAKICPQCGRPFVRKRYWRGRLEDLSAFRRRKCCSHGCANRGRTARWP